MQNFINNRKKKVSRFSKSNNFIIKFLYIIFFFMDASVVKKVEERTIDIVRASIQAPIKI